MSSDLAIQSPKALITNDNKCVLCTSSHRVEIDNIIFARQTPEVESPEPTSLTDTLRDITELLAKYADGSTAPTLPELVYHIHNHFLITTLAGVPARIEGNFALVKDSAYQLLDIKDRLQILLAVGMSTLLEHPERLTLPGVIKTAELLWRMTGTGGDDPFLRAMQEKVIAGNIAPESPLGQALDAREKARGKTKDVTPAPVEGET